MQRLALFKAVGIEGKGVGYVTVALFLLLMFGPNGLRPPGLWASSFSGLWKSPFKDGAFLLAMAGWEVLWGGLAYMVFRNLIAPQRIEGTLTAFEVLEDPKTGKRKISVAFGGANVAVGYRDELQEVLQSLVTGESKIALYVGAFGYVNRLEQLVE